MIGELTLEPRGRDKQFRAPSSLAAEACRLRELGGRKWLSKAARRDQVAPLAGDIAQNHFFALRQVDTLAAAVCEEDCR